MTLNNFTQKDYTLLQDYYQLKIPLNIDAIIPENDSVRLLSQFIEEMNVSELYATYKRIRKNQPSPTQLLKIVLYAYMNRIFSTRDIEKSCKRDINFMFLLEGASPPDHATIARFRSVHLASCSEKLMSEVSNLLFRLGEISAENIFIDGTKIESASNKYTFVWKKAITKHLDKLLRKIADLVSECEERYSISVTYKAKVKMNHVKKLRKKLYALKSEQDIIFVHGIGKRKTPLQRSIEKLEEYLGKLKEYTQKIYRCGERNSYSKTDQDATFMRMKEDAMKNGQLKPAYNLQHGVDSEYVVWLTVGPQPTDTTTLIPFIQGMEGYLQFKYQNIVADAGYESEENYMFIEENKQTSFIKPANYEISKTRKYKNDISKRENMVYDKKNDTYTCKNEKKLVVTGTKQSKSKTGYISKKTQYTCEDCTGCEYKTKCIRGNNSKLALEDRIKKLEVSKVFQLKRLENLERIRTTEGCRLRMNRSIQAEGSFGEVKSNMNFRRYLCKGKRNVLVESILLGIAHNMNKFHNKIQKGRTKTHLFELSK